LCEQRVALEEHANLDALACLLILLRAAAENGRSNEAFEFAQGAASLLLVLGQGFVATDLLVVLADYFDQEVFPLAARSDGVYLQFAGCCPTQSIGFLSHREWHIEGNPTFGMTPNQQAQLRLRVLRGDYGFEYPIGLSPMPMAPDLTNAKAKRKNWSLLHAKLMALVALYDYQQITCLTECFLPEPEKYWDSLIEFVQRGRHLFPDPNSS
jgi:hypothetical protein